MITRDSLMLRSFTKFIVCSSSLSLPLFGSIQRCAEGGLLRYFRLKTLDSRRSGFGLELGCSLFSRHVSTSVHSGTTQQFQIHVGLCRQIWTAPRSAATHHSPIFCGSLTASYYMNPKTRQFQAIKMTGISGNKLLDCSVSRVFAGASKTVYPPAPVLSTPYYLISVAYLQFPFVPRIGKNDQRDKMYRVFNSDCSTPGHENGSISCRWNL
jgi:hypothetical protein